MTLEECNVGVTVKVVRLRVPGEKADPLAVKCLGRVGTITKIERCAEPYPVRIRFGDLGPHPCAFAPDELERVAP